MIRVRQMVLIAGAVASLSVMTLGSASASTGKTVEIVGDQDLGAPTGQPFDFKQGRIVVHRGDTVTWRNETPAPHSMTIVDRTEVPQTLADTLQCAFCERFFAAHAPTIGPEGPVPPFVAAVDGLKASAAALPRLDGVNDSILVAGQGEPWPSTLGGTIGDTASAVIDAPEGSTLYYVCAIHPWMSGTIEVLKHNQK